MTPNQRLLVAVLLSVVFFVVYTAIFPPKEPEVAVNATTKTIEVNSNPVQINQNTISQDQQMVANDFNTLVTVTNKKFILKIDTLGRISSKELLQEKFNSKEDTHAQMISPNGTKPLFLRFLDINVNAEAMKTPYKTSSSSIELNDESQSVTLTQNLSGLVVTKTIIFYADGHYDVKVSLSENKRYFIYVGQRPHVNETEQMMSATGAMVYTD
jgi:YidC/Oxa1 family membrane protein insertase